MIFSFSVSGKVFSQKVSLNLKEVSLKTVLKEIKKQSGYDVFYNVELLEGLPLMSVQFRDLGVKTAMESILRSYGLDFNLDKGTIIIFPKDENVLAQKIIKGKVVSEEGEALIGASVLEKGTKNGSSTNKDGLFELKSEKDAVILTVRMVGYVTQEVNVKSPFTEVVMVKDISALDEVMVVAYGTQKKESVIGAISSIKPSDLRRPTSNLTTSLAGQVAGLIAYQRSGEPGRDNADFFIRGVTSFGYSKSPLILVDGIEMSSRDLAILQPDDIASFSIMKDATSTAVYGARGANGVILITTKKGVEGSPIINVRVENSVSSSIKDVEVADPITFMKSHNEAVKMRNPLDPLPYSMSQIDNVVFGGNPYVYPAVNWHDMLFKDYTTSQRMNFNLSGGGKVARYYVAATYNKDDGILNVDKRNNFNSNIRANTTQIRSNIDITLTNTTELGLKMFGTFDDYNGPLNGGSAMYQMAMRANPVLFPAFFPKDEANAFTKHTLFGNAKDGNYLNPYAEQVKGYQESSNTMLMAQLELYQKLGGLVEGLKGRLLVNTTRNSAFALTRSYVPYYYMVEDYDKVTDKYQLKNINPDTGEEFLSFNPGNKNISTSLYLESALNYDRGFGKHNVSGMLVYILRSTLDANKTTLLESLPYRNLGLSGKFTYNYDSRYFLEGNFGYNGSERFAAKNRFGFFPSIGAAWIVSNESFMKDISWLKTLKLKATIGLIGNDAIGSGAERFFYLSNVNLKSGGGPGFGLDYNFPEFRQLTSILRYANDDITWEKSLKQNLGLELSLRNGLNFQVDVFKEDRSNILMARSSITPEMGLEAAISANVGKASSQGVDASMDYQYAFNSDFVLTGRANFTYAVGKYKTFEEPNYTDAPWLSKVNQPISQTWGYIAERLFIDNQDINNSPKQLGQYMPGDIKYADINKDGLIDFRDQVPIGHPTVPEIVYGFGLSATYKNFDASAFFQGAARQSFWIDVNSTAPFIDSDGGSISNNAFLKAYENSHWSETNQDIYAVWPRLSAAPIENNNQTSTWFMRSADFLRLKNLELGYSFSPKLLEKIRMSRARFYLNGSNLLTLSKFKLWDPEMAGNGLGYPIQRVYNIGVQVTFK
ncbi:TonB-dependent receptor [Pedobacter nyackensis]|uniref:TonB-dependent receptor n=1 Tax=Pedobacter nyackensis TaxID=475255 RepID=UPI0029308856|nr:TonB-dependent receptor [Pedobacter nyackensis]